MLFQSSIYYSRCFKVTLRLVLHSIWERFAVTALEGHNLGFTSTTHKPNLYCGEIDGELILVFHKVDDLDIASAPPAEVAKLFVKIHNLHKKTVRANFVKHEPYHYCKSNSSRKDWKLCVVFC
jgi:hypothetical protein